MARRITGKKNTGTGGPLRGALVAEGIARRLGYTTEVWDYQGVDVITLGRGNPVLAVGLVGSDYEARLHHSKKDLTPRTAIRRGTFKGTKNLAVAVRQWLKELPLMDIRGELRGNPESAPKALDTCVFDYLADYERNLHPDERGSYRGMTADNIRTSLRLPKADSAAVRRALARLVKAGKLIASSATVYTRPTGGTRLKTHFYRIAWALRSAKRNPKVDPKTLERAADMIKSGKLDKATVAEIATAVKAPKNASLKEIAKRVEAVGTQVAVKTASSVGVPEPVTKAALKVSTAIQTAPFRAARWAYGKVKEKMTKKNPSAELSPEGLREALARTRITRGKNGVCTSLGYGLWRVCFGYTDARDGALHGKYTFAVSLLRNNQATVRVGVKARSTGKSPFLRDQTHYISDADIDKLIPAIMKHIPAMEAKMKDTKNPKRRARRNPVWSRAYINKLPDSAFLYIEAGGRKDEQGKTVPRSLRHFPVRDMQGRVSEAHARNAISRIPQSTAKGLTPKVMKALQQKARGLLFFGPAKDQLGALKKPLPKARPHAAIAANPTGLKKFVPWKGAPKKNASPVKVAKKRRAGKKNPNSAAVWSWLEVLKSKLTQYDRRLSMAERKRRIPENIYRLSHYLGAAQEIEKECKKYLQRDDAEALAKFERSMLSHFSPTMPPVKNVQKQLAKYKGAGTMPSLVGNPTVTGQLRNIASFTYQDHYYKVAERPRSGELLWQKVGEKTMWHSVEKTLKSKKHPLAFRLALQRMLPKFKLPAKKNAGAKRTKKATRRNASGAWTVCWRTGMGQDEKDHRERFATRGAADKRAEQLSKKHRGEPITVAKDGFEVAEFYEFPKGARSNKGKRNASRIAPHMWVISKDATGRFIVSIGDPRESTSTLKRRFATLADLKAWVKYDMPQVVSPTRVHDATGLGLLKGGAKRNPTSRGGTLATLRKVVKGDKIAIHNTTYSVVSRTHGKPGQKRDEVTLRGGRGAQSVLFLPNDTAHTATLINLYGRHPKQHEIDLDRITVLGRANAGKKSTQQVKQLAKRVKQLEKVVTKAEKREAKEHGTKAPKLGKRNGPAPKYLLVTKGSTHLKVNKGVTYLVKAITPSENGAKLSLTRMNGLGADPLTLWVRYSKHLDNTSFNASKGDGVHKVTFRVKSRVGEKNPAVATKQPTKAQYAKVASIFRALRKIAAKTCPQFIEARLVVDPSIRDSERHFAMTGVKGGKIVVAIAPELALESKAVIVGVLRHEAGHGIAMLSKTMPAESKGYDAIERHADRTAERVFNTKIYYDHRGVEVSGPGAKGRRPRPAGLR